MRRAVRDGPRPGRSHAHAAADNAFAPDDPAGPRLVFETRRNAEGRYDAAAHLAFVRRVAGLQAESTAATARARPCVIALDNDSVHHAAAVKQAMPALAEAGVTFFYLPPYSPEPNPIESVWRQIKYQDVPERSYPTDTALQTAVEAALSHRAQHLESKSNLPRHAQSSAMDLRAKRIRRSRVITLESRCPLSAVRTGFTGNFAGNERMQSIAGGSRSSEE